MTPEHSKSIGIYLHVPFCATKCLYCDFCSAPPAEGNIERYVNALCKEIRMRSCGRPAATLYIGGGTPSFIDVLHLSRIVDLLKGCFHFEPNCEITVEANPGDVTDSWLRAAHNMGVNRLSLGVQGMRDEDLQFLERRHNVADAIEAARRARAAGFGNLSIDLIAGLPGHTPELTSKIISRAVSEFAPEHISCYQLTCVADTRLHTAVERGAVRMLDDDEQAAIFIATHETLARLGYEGYEVSNFARSSGLRSRHNSAYWSHQDYIGLGPAAHSFLNPVRSWNTEKLDEYCSSLEKDELPTLGCEELTRTQLAEEIILLGLRTRDGIDIDKLRTECAVDLPAEKSAFIADAVAQGLLIRTGTHIRPTLQGLAIADSLAADLIP